MFSDERKTHQRNDPMTVNLEVQQAHQRKQMANVQRTRGRVNANIDSLALLLQRAS